jgi:hypothetical protein
MLGGSSAWRASEHIYSKFFAKAFGTERAEEESRAEMFFVLFLQVCHLIGRLCESYGEVFDGAWG